MQIKIECVIIWIVCLRTGLAVPTAGDRLQEVMLPASDDSLAISRRLIRDGGGGVLIAEPVPCEEGSDKICIHVILFESARCKLGLDAAFIVSVDMEIASRSRMNERSRMTGLDHLSEQVPAWAKGDADGYWDFYKLSYELSKLSDDVNPKGIEITTIDIGGTWMKRPINSYVLKKRSRTGTNVNKPSVLYVSLSHASEVLGLQALLAVLFHIAQHGAGSNPLPEIADLLDKIDIHFIPVANPDAYIENVKNRGGGLHRSNLRPTCPRGIMKEKQLIGGGINLNRNYDFEWNATERLDEVQIKMLEDPCSINYRGPSPFSELETQAIQEYLARNRQIYALLEFHGLPIHMKSLLIHPYAYSVRKSPSDKDQAIMDRLALAMDSNIFRKDEAMYVYGNANESIHYMATGTLVDYAYDKHGIMSFVVEVGNAKEFWPPSSEMIQSSLAHLKPAIAFALEAAKIWAVEGLHTAESEQIPSSTAGTFSALLIVACFILAAVLIFKLSTYLRKRRYSIFRSHEQLREFDAPPDPVELHKVRREAKPLMQKSFFQSYNRSLHTEEEENSEENEYI